MVLSKLELSKAVILYREFHKYSESERASYANSCCFKFHFNGGNLEKLDQTVTLTTMLL